MKRSALNIACISFFVLAGICWACGLDPLTCATRATGGSIAVFVIVLIAGRIALNMIVTDVMNQSRENEVKDPER